MPQSRFKAVLALVAAMVLVGSSVAVGRIITLRLPIYFASLVRFALASLVLAPLVVWREGRIPPLSGRSLALVCGQALCGSFLFTICLLAGLRLTGAAEAGVLAAATPAAVALLGRILFRERLTFRAAAGIAATIGGIAMLHAQHPGGPGAASFWGNALILCAVGFEAVFLLLRRAMRQPLSPLAAALWVSVFGMVLFLLPGLWQVGSLRATDLGPTALAALAYYGLGVTAVAYMLWFYGVVRVDAATAGVTTGVMPVAALIFAAVLCGERIGWAAILGCGGVLAGIVCLAGGGDKKRPRPALPQQRKPAGA